MRDGYNPYGNLIQTDVLNLNVMRSEVAHFQVPAAQATAVAVSGILSAVACGSAAIVETTGISQPSVPRNITASVGGTEANIEAAQVIVTGTNIAGAVITETLPAFTAATAGTVSGVKAFATITSITIPANGAGVTVEIGFGDALGLPYMLYFNTVLAAYLNSVKEATAPTVEVSSTNVENNTITLNSALAGESVDVYLIVG